MPLKQNVYSDSIMLTLFGIAFSLLPLHPTFFLDRHPTSPLWNELGFVFVLMLALIFWRTKILRVQNANNIRSLALFAIFSLSIIWAGVVGSADIPTQWRGIYRLLAVTIFTFVLVRGTSQRFLFKLLFLFLATVCLQAQWGVLHFALQDDLGLRLLGESYLQADSGIANFTFGDGKIVRAYGPYGHPNILSGACIIALIALLILFPYHRLLLYTPALSSLSLPLIGATLLTFSRAAYLALFLLFCVAASYVSLSRFTSRAIILSMLVLLALVPFFVARFTDPADMALPERVFGTQVSLDIIASLSPWYGTGINRYPAALEEYLLQRGIVYFPWQVDNVHNAVLLALAELGLVPFLVVVGVIGWIV
ncbi:MAG: O-antigen ligase family protein, partial [Acidobacteriota bacterium]